MDRGVPLWFRTRATRARRALQGIEDPELHRDLTCIAINLDEDRSKVAGALAEAGWTEPVSYLDKPLIGKDITTDGIPKSFVLDSSGPDRSAAPAGRRSGPSEGVNDPPRYALDVIAATDDGLFVLDDGEVLDGRPARFVDGDGRALLSDGTLLDAEGREVARVPDATCFAVTPGGDWIVGTEGASLFVVRSGEVTRVEAFDRAPTRERWYTPWGGPPAVRSLAVTPDRWYVAVHVGGVLSTDRPLPPPCRWTTPR